MASRLAPLERPFAIAARSRESLDALDIRIIAFELIPLRIDRDS
jgi:hypothetical protein